MNYFFKEQNKDYFFQTYKTEEFYPPADLHQKKNTDGNLNLPTQRHKKSRQMHKYKDVSWLSFRHLNILKRLLTAKRITTCCGVYNRCRRCLYLHVCLFICFHLVVISTEKSDKYNSKYYQNTHVSLIACIEVRQVSREIIIWLNDQKFHICHIVSFW